MRVQVDGGDLHVHAVAGSHVVTFGLDWPEKRASELQGFALHRTNHRTGRADWIEAQKRYRSTDPGTDIGQRVSTRQHPVQTFLWADYTVDPGSSTPNRVLALGGQLDRLVELAEATVGVTTIVRTTTGHLVHFNRGAVAAQEYARRFKNVPPEEVPNGGAYEWLSRGLFQALVKFIDAAEGSDELYVAIHEARHNGPLDALRRARDRGVTVNIVYDAKDNGDTAELSFQRDENVAFLDDNELLEGAVGRTRNPGYIAHNKFVVLVKQGQPKAVFSGSTNWSPNGFFGQLNAGHEVWNADVAKQYLAYWKLLKGDPEAKDLRKALDNGFTIPEAWPDGCTTVFSPQPLRNGLDRYIGSADGAEAVFVTLAFSLDDKLAASFKTESDGLRYVLMDGINGNKKQVEKIAAAVKDIRATEAARVSIGAYLRGNALDQFLLERSNTLATHVQFIHTKFMLVDPLGVRPLVISGSANFSLASCTQNDENMLIVAGDDEVADIYLGEFMRSYSHYAFREAVASARKANRPFVANPLNEDCTWAQAHYGDGFRSRQRRYFARGKV
ncbi:phospholipase D-like domain-containing protein (plasmid) [Comamonadaceae bacterium OTU4NAUVB1]|nr:phospholipase D-like domain-containing protein [Comamonadaceae bacterium OTU4NAUVB1]